MQSEPIRVVVTGAAGQIAYSLLYMIANGEVFGKDQKLILNLLDIEPMMGVLNGEKQNSFKFISKFILNLLQALSWNSLIVLSPS